MAATEKSKPLLALTTAALGLPGITANASTPSAIGYGNVQYGHYQESDNRMQVDIYHGDFTIPVTDRLEFGVSIDRDTYSGATPAFSIPTTAANQPKNDANSARADVVSAASGGVDSAKLGGYRGLSSFREPFDAISASGIGIQRQIQSYTQSQSAPLDAYIQQQTNAYLASNPSPGLPDTISTPTSITFDGIGTAVYGKANVNTGSFCPGGAGCYQQNNFVVGTIDDPLNNDGHIHRSGTPSNRVAQYHADSSGYYLRHFDGRAFSATDLILNILDFANNPAGSTIEILGFNTAINPNLNIGDGTNYATRVAYQSVPLALRSGQLALNSAFQNINALWIHYSGLISDVTNRSQVTNEEWNITIDNINLSPANFPNATPEQIAWLNAYNAFVSNLESASAPQRQAILAQAEEIKKQLEKAAVIAAFDSFLNKAIPPKTQTKQVMQQQPRETRTQPTFNAKYHFDEGTLGLSGGQSTEPDFISTFGGINFSHEFNNKLDSVSFSYSAASNKIGRNTPSHTKEEHNHDENTPTYPQLNETSLQHSFNLGFSHILDKNTLMQWSANYSRQEGYLSNPYKYVYVRGEITAAEYYEMAYNPESVNWNDVTKLEIVGIDLFRETRPRLRNQFSLSTRLNHYLSDLDATLHADYRYYVDDWGIDSHTLELKWFQKLPWGLTVTPNVRYYSQSKADFFAPYFLAPRADGFYSSDFRLSDYGAVSSGITIAKQFNRGIRLELGMEYYSHQGDLKLGGGGESNYADFSYWMTHANLSIDLSAPGQILGSGAGHHHHHLGASLPAGVMYGHMMPQADALMIGYRYMYANQTGDMFNGSKRISDATVRQFGCGNTLCSERPSEMNMHMHMLELMYAPTDWLNLMLMPQLVDMDMELSPLTTGADSQHNGSHEVHALGDTQITAMTKVFDKDNHHMHIGLGLSAPTGDVNATLDGRDEPDSQLQDYGMQPGSGTWDFLPSLTYTGFEDNWSWGVQFNGIKRLSSRNASEYALGDRLQGSIWGGYKINQWLSANVRGVYTYQERVRNHYINQYAQSATVDFTQNYGGRFYDVGFGLNLHAPEGPFAGHNLSLEWLQPVSDKYNGYQLEREGSLFATWSYQF